MKRSNPLPQRRTESDDSNGALARPLVDTIRELEEAAIDPIVAGELSSWCHRVLPKLTEVHAIWQSEADERRAMHRDIETTDPESIHRSEELGEQEQTVEDQLLRICDRLGDLAHTDDPDRPRGVAEATRMGDARTARAAILHWSVDARMLLADLAHRLTEALYRDRGTPGG